MSRRPFLNLALTLIGGAIAGWIGVGWLSQDSKTAQAAATSPSSLLGMRRQPVFSQNTQALIHRIQETAEVSQQFPLGIELAQSIPADQIEHMLSNKHLLPANNVRDVLARQLLHRWLDHEPEKALQWALVNSRSAAYPLMSHWFRKDPERAMHFARDYPFQSGYSSLFRGMAASVADEGIDPLFEFIHEHIDHSADSNFVAGIWKLAKDDPHGVLARLHELPESLAETSNVLIPWAKKDPAAAFAWAKESGDVDHLEEVIDQVKDPQEALAMLATLTPEQQAEVDKSIKALYHQPERILSLLENYEGLTEETFASLEERAKRRLEPKEPRTEPPPKNAADLAEIIHANKHLDDDDLKQADIGALTQAIAALDPEEANRNHMTLLKRAREEHFYEIAATQVPFLSANDPQALKVVADLGANWAHHDPRAATAWIETLPTGELKTWAARNAAKQWGRSNETAARAWLARLPEGIPWDHPTPN